jgi:hypothetical protein
MNPAMLPVHPATGFDSLASRTASAALQLDAAQDDGVIRCVLAATVADHPSSDEIFLATQRKDF